MILRISRFAVSSSPERLSPPSTFSVRSKVEDDKPASISPVKLEGSPEYRWLRPGNEKLGKRMRETMLFGSRQPLRARRIEERAGEDNEDDQAGKRRHEGEEAAEDIIPEACHGVSEEALRGSFSIRRASIWRGSCLVEGLVDGVRLTVGRGPLGLRCWRDNQSSKEI